MDRERVMALLRYDAECGVFTWRSVRTGQPKQGSVAGYVDKAGYRYICVDGRDYKASRLAWLIANGEWPNGDIDHINMVRDDDRISNLRIASRSQNLANRRKRGDSRQPFKGVRKNTLANTWAARVCGKYIGSFPTPEEAAAAYRVAADAKFGAFARHG